MSSSITWTVTGANWQENIQAPVTTSPIEIATSAVEKVWARPSMTEQVPSVGFVLEISHQNMKSQGEHIVVLSALVLANAGLHKESAELNRLWEDSQV